MIKKKNPPPGTPSQTQIPTQGFWWQELEKASSRSALFFLVVLSPPTVSQILLYYKKDRTRNVVTDVLSSINSCMETQVYVTHLQPLLMSLCNMAILMVI